jgi:hypothetical protein
MEDPETHSQEREDPRQHHFLEDRAAPSVRGVIDMHAATVWKRLRVKLNCLEASIWWHQVFQSEGVPSELHGRVGGADRGGYVSTQGVVESHVWLVVGAERAMFDATFEQLLDDPPWSLSRYIVEDGQAFRTGATLSPRTGLSSTFCRQYLSRRFGTGEECIGREKWTPN